MTIGVKLLLSLMGSRFVTRTACVSVGSALPVFSTYKAIESGNNSDQLKMLTYWAVYGSFNIVEKFTDKLLYWIPYYYESKLACLLWLQYPSAVGACKLYADHLRPFFRKQQDTLDKGVGYFHRKILAKLFNKHETVFGFPKTVIIKSLLRVLDAINFSGQQQDGRQLTYEAPPDELQDDE